MPHDDEIRESLNAMLIDVLAVEPEELTPDARFFEDLAGESIDLLELAFLAEKRFGQRVEFQKMVDPALVEIDSSRKLTAASIERMGQALPFLDVEDLRKQPDVDALRHLLTVENLFQYLRQTIGTSA